ncbi:MAG: response regulator [SAR324 cluster bacterium]|nr:response regulator [SAR324 cluster bacterium]MCH8888376.1 response regulator [SAR324 cluster bacterium]
MELDTSIKILIAEDNPNLRQVLVNIIRKIGFDKILEAENGEIAWQFIQRGGVNLVLTDWAMPELDGMQLLKKIRNSDAPTCDIPFLMITAADTKNAIMSAGKSGVDAYVIKPFSVSTVVEKIKEAIEKRDSL